MGKQDVPLDKVTHLQWLYTWARESGERWLRGTQASRACRATSNPDSRGRSVKAHPPPCISLPAHHVHSKLSINESCRMFLE